MRIGKRVENGGKMNETAKIVKTPKRFVKIIGGVIKESSLLHFHGVQLPSAGKVLRAFLG